MNHAKEYRVCEPVVVEVVAIVWALQLAIEEKLYAVFVEGVGSFFVGILLME